MQTTWLERSIVNGRVALLLRSVEIQLLFERFVRLRGSLAFSIPPFPFRSCTPGGFIDLQNSRLARAPGSAPPRQPTRRAEAPLTHSPHGVAERQPGPREWRSSQPATPRACSLASEAFRCQPLALLPGATSECASFRSTGHSPGSMSYRPNYPWRLSSEGTPHESRPPGVALVAASNPTSLQPGFGSRPLPIPSPFTGRHLRECLTFRSTGHSPGSGVSPAQLPLQPTFGRHGLPGFHDWPMSVFLLSHVGTQLVPKPPQEHPNHLHCRCTSPTAPQ